MNDRHHPHRKEDEHITRVEGKLSQRERTPQSPESGERSKDLYKVRGILSGREMEKLKDFLKTRGGEVSTISGSFREEAQKKIGKISRFRHAWSTEEIHGQIEKFVENGSFLDAYEFVQQNEQYIVESWVEGLLEKKLYHQARALLHEYAKSKPAKRMNPRDIELDVEIDAMILGGVSRELQNPADIGRIGFELEHDRVWSAVHNGYFEQAAEMCDQLYEKAFGRGHKEAKPETQTQAAKRHEKELKEALPKDMERMKEAFGSLPEVITHFHHLADIGRDDEPYLYALKGQCQHFVERLFREGKIVVQRKGIFAAQEELLGFIDDLGYLGMHLYIHKKGDDNALTLLADHEVEPGYAKVDLRLLNACDLILDDENFTEKKAASTPRSSDEEITEVMEPSEYAWTSKVVRIGQHRANELRRAA